MKRQDVFCRFSVEFAYTKNWANYGTCRKYLIEIQKFEKVFFKFPKLFFKNKCYQSEVLHADLKLKVPKLSDSIKTY